MKVIEEFVINGCKAEDVMLIPGCKMRVHGPAQRSRDRRRSPAPPPPMTGTRSSRPGENTYGRVYANSGALAGAGSITGAILRGMVMTQKPVLPEDRMDSPRRRKPTSAPGLLSPQKKWVEASLWEDGVAQADNHIVGPPSSNPTPPPSSCRTVSRPRSTSIACSISKKSSEETKP